MISSLLELPSWEDRPLFADEAEFPQLWDGLDFAFVPQLGNTGSKYVEMLTGDRLSQSSPFTFAQSEYGWVLNNTGNAVAATTETAWPRYSGEMTAVALIRTTTVAATYRTIVSQTPSGGVSDFELVANSLAGRLSAYVAGGTYNGTSAVLSANTWHVVALVRRGGTSNWTIDLWCDGVLDSSHSVLTGNNSGPAVVRIGGFGTSSSFSWRGDIGPVWLWKRRLLPGELQQLAADPFAPLRSRFGASWGMAVAEETPEPAAAEIEYWRLCGSEGLAARLLGAHGLRPALRGAHGNQTTLRGA